MMEANALTGFVAAAVVILAGFLWAMICNQRTYRQRIKLIDAYDWNTYEHYKAVSYGEHFWALVLFKDAMDLYHPDLVRQARP